MFASVRLRALGGDSARKVTWLELFFDLVFVAAVAQVAEPLHEHYTWDGVARFAVLFTLIWWAWTGSTLFATRFTTDDVVQRLLTLVQMFVVAVMAANAGDALDSRSSAGFAAAYAVLRFLLVGQYLRARTLVTARAFATWHVIGHGAAATLWLVSAVVAPPLRFPLWAVALAIDLGTPWVALHHSLRVPPDAAHVPERFGLFTLILLGEAVVAVMHGMESQEHWPLSAAVAAFTSLGTVFILWWAYFDGIGAAGDRRVRAERDALRFQVWSYAHYPLYLGIVVASVGARRVVTAAANTALERGDLTLMAAGAFTIALSLAAIWGAKERPAASEPEGRTEAWQAERA